MSDEKSKPEVKPVGMMTAKELTAHIEELDTKHKSKMKHHRALLRTLEAAD